MDNPVTESSVSLDTNQAASLFASMLDDGGNVRKDEPAEKPAEAKIDANTEAQAPDADTPSDQEMVEIDVDGYKVSLPKDKAEKLEAERLRQADYTRKTMQTAEERKAAQAEAQKAFAERQAYAQNLSRMQAQLEGSLLEQQKTIDWDQLLQSDPAEYLKQQHLAQKRQAALQQVVAEQQQLRARQEAESQQAFARHLEEQQQALLAKLPEWKDETKAKAERTAIRDFLLKQGYSEQEVSNVADSRAVLMARNAMLYEQLMSKASAASKKVSTLPSKVERPGSGDAPNLDKRAAAYQRLGKSGKVEDAAAVFASLL